MPYNNSIKRIRQIIKIFAYYGFGFIVGKRIKGRNNSPENLRKAFENLGPTFIKIGQILSTRPDILPKEYINELSKLQDNAPPETYISIAKVFFDEFNTTIEDAFLFFNKTPLACASISQVHEAILKDGSIVIVKLQRPEIASTMRTDLSIIRKVVDLTKTKLPNTLISPKEALDEIIYCTKLELNFKNEANNIEKFKSLNKDIAFVYCPSLVRQFCSNKVLTMEKINGFKINNTKLLLEEGYNLDNIGRKLALSYLNQVLHDGFFHGDPHPGNLIIKDNKICYIDFGIMGNLPEFLKDALNDAIVAIVFKDINKVVSVLISVGEKKGLVDKNVLYEDIDYLFSNYLSTSLRNIKISTLLQEIFNISSRNNIKLPKDFTILIRSMIIIEGVIAKISPDLSLLDVAIPYVKSNMRHNFDPNQAILDSYLFLNNTSKLPAKFIELSDNILSGRVKLKLQHTNLEKSIVQLHRMINRVVLAFIISSMIISSSFILTSNVGPKIFGMSIIGISGFMIAAVMAFCLLISIIKSGMF